ncbi:MAG: hypothetical protein MH112_03325 [Phenylobacterium sp.]|uniref:hypothetical protein n=1 Tax=Phenylobacterium sp. TaxID=1871053 RepID=UPI0025D78BB2|nr:hypothetical protein [Phenylobacterium sp.]MCG9915377.1 hypothetical protein [Phenylobacterium sp.]
MPPRLKPTRLGYVVDGVRLRAQLSDAALEGVAEARTVHTGGDLTCPVCGAGPG